MERGKVVDWLGSVYLGCLGRWPSTRRKKGRREGGKGERSCG